MSEPISSPDDPVHKPVIQENSTKIWSQEMPRLPQKDHCDRKYIFSKIISYVFN
jgi:hypothetical protein